ncbi:MULTISPECIES: hypothetical protein [Citrobacter]|uniref:hypothetical protein n=1 Tax=Citrobacter sp. Cpo221 TaxID=2985155 RepID=UPI002577D7AB|nr:hypothetical protein [Citrobacter sp. Cpo221]MDM2753112.1 hypothetical protein [Citrobacter sp. Cpo221]
MSLEQRVEALEMAVASMAAQQSNTEEITDIVRKVTAGVIASALRPGGAINAAQKQAAVEIKKADGVTAVRLGRI